MQQAVAARDAAIAASIASRPAPVKRPVGRPKVLAPLGVQASPGERHVWAQLQLRWSGQAVWVVSKLFSDFDENQH